jgi:hypothetical protein
MHAQVPLPWHQHIKTAAAYNKLALDPQHTLAQPSYFFTAD